MGARRRRSPEATSGVLPARGSGVGSHLPPARVLPRDRYFDPARCGLSSWELELGRPLFYFLPRSNCDNGFCESEKEARRSGDAGSATQASTRFPPSPLGTRALGSCSLSRGPTPQAHCGASLSAPEFISRRPPRPEDPCAPKTPAPRYLVSQPHPAWRRGPAPSFGSTSPRDLLTGSPEGFSARGRVWGFPGGRHVDTPGQRGRSAGDVAASSACSPACLLHFRVTCVYEKPARSQDTSVRETPRRGTARKAPWPTSPSCLVAGGASAPRGPSRSRWPRAT